MNKSTKFKEGDSVVVKKGTKDPDFNILIEGWCGRITSIGKGKFMRIKWDSETIKNMPLNTIKESEEQGLDWSRMDLYKNEVESCKSRDKPEDADEEISKIQWEHFREEYFPEYCED